MSKDRKTLKVLCLIGLFLGIALVVAGIVLAVGGHAIGGVCLLVTGVLCMVGGVRGAKAANTPSSAGKTTPLLAVEGIVGGACVPVNTMTGIEVHPSVLVTAAGAVVLVLGVLAAVFSHRVYQASLK